MAAPSGVTVKDEVCTEYLQLKMKHCYTYIQMKISPDNQFIVMDKVVEKAEYEDFVAQLPEKEGRYAVFDFNCKLENGTDKKGLIFFQWCPDAAPVRTKMLFASSKDSLKKKLEGIFMEFQASDLSDLKREDVESKFRAKTYQ
jgi:cofilin